MRELLLGAHISVSGGLSNAPERGRTLTCDCMQIFSKNQMQWKAKPIDLEEAGKFIQNSKEFGISETVIHDSYLINLSSPEKNALRQSREAFLDEMVRARHLGVRCLIFHPGAHMGSGERAGFKRIAESLNWARKEMGSGDVQFILEITAGQGTYLGGSFEHLRAIIGQLEDQKNVGVCFDTCHAYAAGYDVKTKAGYARTFELFDDIVGLSYLKAMHLNDSKGKQGSHMDRHEQIGKGFIGVDGFRNFMTDSRWERIPMVLETPAGDKMYKQELKLLRSMIKKR